MCSECPRATPTSCHAPPRSRPENLAARQLPSVTSVDSLEEGVERSSTMGTMSTVDRLILRGSGRGSTTKSRPLSEVSSASSRDLEASFEVWFLVVLGTYVLVYHY